MSRQRILRLAVVFGLAAAALILALAKIAIVDHDAWLERSLRNRWAFRDVPTRRGDIVSRDGVVLARDVPGFDLELTYGSFRRAHPLAACIHAGNLLAGLTRSDEEFTFVAFERAHAALDQLLALPMREFGASSRWTGTEFQDGASDDPPRDLRFYLGTAIASLSGAHRPRLAVALAKEAQGSNDATALLTLWRMAESDSRLELPRVESPAALAEALHLALKERIVELGALDLRLARARPRLVDFSLWRFLDERRELSIQTASLAGLSDSERRALEEEDFWAFLLEREIDWSGWPDWRTWRTLPVEQRSQLVRAYDDESARRLDQRAASLAEPGAAAEPLFRPIPAGVAAPRFPSEHAPRVVMSRLPHDLASWVAMLAERHPGFTLRASVLRERGRLPGMSDLMSVANVVGRVGLYSPEGRTPTADAAAILAEEADFARAEMLAHEAGDLSDRIEDSLRERAEAALRAHYGRRGRIGRSGVELAMDDTLSGRPGLRFVERDKRARELRMFDSLDVAPGTAVALSLDSRLCVLAERALGPVEKGREKALVVLDPHTGDVLAIAASVWRDSETSPSPSLAVWMPSYTAYVGSVAKPLIALEYLRGLRTGEFQVPPSSFPVCGGRPEPYDRRRRLRCGEVHGEGARDTVHAIAESCNVYFFQIADELGADRVREIYASFGWDKGGATDAAPGFQRSVDGFADRSWPRPRWRPARFPLPLVAIGYGMEVWPLFVARAYAGIATNRLTEVGFLRAPREAIELEYHAADLEAVRRGLAECVTHGTARAIASTAARMRTEFGLELFGKTGTAEVTEDGTRNNAWFAGFLGQDADARLAFAAVDYRTDDHGGTVAAPIVARFLEAIADDPVLREEFLLRSPSTDSNEGR